MQEIDSQPKGVKIEPFGFGEVDPMLQGINTEMLRGINLKLLAIAGGTVRFLVAHNHEKKAAISFAVGSIATTDPRINISIYREILERWFNQKEGE